LKKLVEDFRLAIIPIAIAVARILNF